MRPRLLSLTFVLGTLLTLCGDSLAAQRGTATILRVRDATGMPGVHGLADVPAPRPAHATPPPRAERGGSLPAILLTGYWPPSNEALRRFSPDPAQNPLGWIGADWEGRGYDVYSFFPEFSPPTCSSCGKGTGDLEVDYQDTSTDFWAIADSLEPIAIITFSRGNPVTQDWELEMNQFNRSWWIPDYLPPLQPDPSPPETDFPVNQNRPSTLPVVDIVNAVAALGIGLTPFVCWTGDGGGFLSEFIAYHGAWYQSEHRFPTEPDWCVAAGHVHVGGAISWQNAELAAQETVRTVATYVDAVVAATVCQTDIGFGGPGTASLAICGQSLSSGNHADLLVYDGPVGARGWLVVGTTFGPTPWLGGTVVPNPYDFLVSATLDAEGRWTLPAIPGGGGPLTYYAQFVYRDSAQPQGWGFSNAVQAEFLP